jgi:peptidoglycan/LPS O-acetylase OafA/YrhL
MREPTDGRGTADSHVQKYRPDIDGLRAVAVISVVLYHVNSSVIPGGYLGVDVFFVISGFLITSIIQREQERGLFSLSGFYERRVRRIMPALLFVLVATLIASTIMLLPSDLIGYGKSLLSTVFFSANFYFLIDTDYFAAAAEQKPLLHMWSLGVEEQFYLFFPLILMLLQRFRRSLLVIITALTAISLLANIGALHLAKADVAFFLTPFRAWELGFGAMLAVWLRRTGPSAPQPVAAVIGAVLLALGLAGVKLSGPVALPIALSAVAGTTILIWAHHGGQTVVGRLLSTRPFVLIGLISYSLYLWHWPFIVFPRYYLVRELTLLEGSIAVFASMMLATISWRYVERPFRQKMMPARRVYILTLAATLVTVSAGIALVRGDGFPGRLNARAAAINIAVDSNYRCPVAAHIPFGALHACSLALPDKNPNSADTVLFGNSHAQMYAPAVAAALANSNRRGLLVPANGCLPSVDVNISAGCDRIMRENLAAIVDLPNVHTVIIAFNWAVPRKPKKLVDGTGRPLVGDYSALVADGVGRAIEELQAAGKETILVGPIATPRYNVASVISRKLAFGHSIGEPLWIAQAEFLAQHEVLLAALSQRPGVVLLTPHEYQCRDARCYYVDGGDSLFADGNHLAGTVQERFVPLFERSLAREP